MVSFDPAFTVLSFTGNFESLLSDPDVNEIIKKNKLRHNENCLSRVHVSLKVNEDDLDDDDPELAADLAALEDGDDESAHDNDKPLSAMPLPTLEDVQRLKVEAITLSKVMPTKQVLSVSAAVDENLTISSLETFISLLRNLNAIEKT